MKNKCCVQISDSKYVTKILPAYEDANIKLVRYPCKIFRLIIDTDSAWKLQFMMQLCIKESLIHLHMFEDNFYGNFIP